MKRLTSRTGSLPRYWLFPAILLGVVWVCVLALIVLRATAPDWPERAEQIRLDPEPMPTALERLQKGQSFHFLRLIMEQWPKTRPGPMIQALDASSPDDWFDAPVPEVEAWIAAHEEVLDLWHSAARSTNTSAVLPGEGDWSFLKPMTRLARYRAERAGAQKQWLPMLDACYDAVAVSQRRWSITGWEGIPEHAEELRKALDHVRAMSRRRADYPDLVRRLYAAMVKTAVDRQSAYADILRNERVRRIADWNAGQKEPPWTSERGGWGAWLTRSSRDTSMRHLDAVWSQWIRRVQAPYAANALSEQFADGFEGQPQKRAFFNDPGMLSEIQRVLPAAQKGWGQWLDIQAHLRAVYLDLSLRWYAADHEGVPPNDLNELTPDFVRDLPSDPYRPSQPLNYRRRTTGWSVYSVGPDGRDDGGDPDRDRVLESL